MANYLTKRKFGAGLESSEVYNSQYKDYFYNKRKFGAGLNSDEVYNSQFKDYFYNRRKYNLPMASLSVYNEFVPLESTRAYRLNGRRDSSR